VNEEPASAPTEAKPRRSRALTWLHRVGYVTTAIVVIFVGVVLSYELGHILDARARSVAWMEETRTHAGPMRAAQHEIFGPDVRDSLSLLPPLRALHGDGLRFLVSPSFGEANYSIALWLAPEAQVAEGLLVVATVRGTGEAAGGARRFSMPRTDDLAMMERFDRKTDHWGGTGDHVLDGTSTGFERVRGERVTSGFNNGPHEAELRAIVLDALRRFAPRSDLPTDESWMWMAGGREARRR